MDSGMFESMPGQVVFESTDLLRCRFATSPLWETLAALHTLFEPHRQNFHLPWVRSVRLPDGVDLSTVLLLFPRPGYVPDFLSPPPEGPLTSIEDELARVRATPVERVDDELRSCLLDPRRALPTSVTDPFLDDPASTRDFLADLLALCWDHLIRPHWPRVRALLDADISLRAHTLAEKGLAALMTDLDGRLAWDGTTLNIAEPSAIDRVRLGDRGLLLMPSAFVWPDLVMISDDPWQPTLIYPVRGVGELWTAGEAPPRTLVPVLGRTRAQLLAHLALPETTGNVAARLGLSPATVSAALTALRGAGLVEARRSGREVFYVRSPLGTALLGGAEREEA
jgi:DNA-binding transcriptional ArsR family regulator